MVDLSSFGLKKPDERSSSQQLLKVI